jgi:hypothetical protein
MQTISSSDPIDAREAGRATPGAARGFFRRRRHAGPERARFMREIPWVDMSQDMPQTPGIGRKYRKDYGLLR